MLIYIIRRVLIFIPMLLVISFLVYGALELTPGDAVSALINPEVSGRLTEAQFNELRESYGLNKPFLVRYGIWVANVLQGNFGHSLAGGVPISTIFLDRLPATLELSVVALLFSTIVGCILGTFSALKRGSIADNSLTVVGMLGVSIPEFFFGLVALLIFALNLGWLPVGGRLLPGYDSILDRVPHIIMPAMVLSLMMTCWRDALRAFVNVGCVEQGIYQDGAFKGPARMAHQFDAWISCSTDAGCRPHWVPPSFADWWFSDYRTGLSMAWNWQRVYRSSPRL